jgi:hypothetical protein
MRVNYLKVVVLVLVILLIGISCFSSSIADAPVSEVWVRTRDTWGRGESVAVDSEDNIIVTGSQFDTIKYDKYGTELWNATYDSGDDIQEYAYGVAVDSNDNIIVTGYSPHNGTVNFYTIKYYPSGTELWNSSFDMGQEIAYCIAIDSNDNIIIAGEFYIYHNRYNTWDGIIVKIDSDGNELWNLTYDTGESNLFKGIAVDSNDNILVVGYTENWSISNAKFVTLKLTDDDSILNEIKDTFEDLHWLYILIAWI